MKAKYVVLSILGVGAIVGFGIAASKTNGGKGSRPSVVPAVQYAEVGPKIGGGSGWDATLYDSGSPVVSLAAADKTAAIALVHAKMKERGVSLYFIFTKLDDGTWWASGYRDGESASEDMGPYASQALAMQAGTSWVQKTAAVPVPVEEAAIGARSMSRKARRAIRSGSCKPEDLIWDPARNRMVCPDELVVATSGSSPAPTICPPGWHKDKNGFCVQDQIAF